MQEPPSPWLVAPFVAVALWQSYRLAKLRRTTLGMVGSEANYLAYLAFAPSMLAMLNAEKFTPLAAAIEWSREYYLVLLVTGSTLVELSLRVTVLVGARRVLHIAETSNVPRELDRACEALQALGLHEAAIVGLNRLANVVSDPARVHTAVAALHGIQRRFLQAEASARRAVALDAELPLAHAYLSLSLLEQNRTEEAARERALATRLGVNFDAFAAPRKRSNPPS